MRAITGMQPPFNPWRAIKQTGNEDPPNAATFVAFLEFRARRASAELADLIQFGSRSHVCVLKAVCPVCINGGMGDEGREVERPNVAACVSIWTAVRAVGLICRGGQTTHKQAILDNRNPLLLHTIPSKGRYIIRPLGNSGVDRGSGESRVDMAFRRPQPWLAMVWVTMKTLLIGLPTLHNHANRTGLKRCMG